MDSQKTSRLLIHAGWNNLPAQAFRWAVVVGVQLLGLHLVGHAQQTPPTNTNIAGPQATANGAVTNQAVQVLQGPYAVNTYGGGTSCQSATFNVQGFAYGNSTYSTDPNSFTNNVLNPGFTVGLSMPLDKSLQRLCRDRARVETERAQAEADKARLDYELVRLLRCGEAKKQGIYFSADSPYRKVCSDVMVRQPGQSQAMN